MKIDRAKAEKNLPQKGFVTARDRHHIFFHHEVNGRRSKAWTKISHTKGVKDIDKGLLTAMRKQLCLQSNSQVKDLCECPMDGEQYIQALRSQGLLNT